MGKKLPNIVKLKKGIYSSNIPSVKKANKINNNYNKKKKKNKRKRHKNNQNAHNFSSQKKDNISNNNFFINNLSINNNNGNPFIFNAVYNNKKEKEKPDWMSLETQKIQDINNRFNEEIYEYVNYIIPKNFSLSQRQSTKQRLINIIKKHQPKWQVVLFGSFSQNTSTIFSDLDFAILSNDIDSSRKMDINELIYLMKILKHDGFSRNIRLIRARVPILKATCSLTGINVDISVNRQNGCQAAGLIRNILKKHQILKPSIIILKILLKKNNLNDAHTGGMSSFLLFHLVYFYYITYKKRNGRNRFNNDNDMNINEDEKEDISYNDNNSNIEDNNEEKQEDEYIDENEDNYDEEKEISYDSNSELKWNGKNKLITKDGMITKPISSTDEEDNSNDDSNVIKNGNSSSNSEEVNVSHTKNKNKNVCDFIQDFDENEDEDDGEGENEGEGEGDDGDYKNDNNDFNNNEEEKNNEDKNSNIGHFIFTFLKFYGKEFSYREFGFSLNENNFGDTFFKLERTDMDCSDYICAESIQEQGIDVGRSCYNYPKIVNLFKTSYNKIKIEKQKNTCSILKSLGFPSI